VTDRLPALVPFISRLQLERIRRTGPLETAASQSLKAALLFLDVAGFSTVAERLREEGPRGAELLSRILGAYFRPVLETIRIHGGDVLFFAGDAIAVSWHAGAGQPPDIRECLRRAAHCALEIQRAIRGIEPPLGTALRFRASLGAGPLEALELGGVNGRWMQVVRGNALASACRADQAASPGQVTMAADCLTLLEGAGPVTEPAGGEGYLRLVAMGQVLEPAALPDPGLDPAMGGAREDHLAEIVATRMDSAEGDFHAEFRQVTVVFMNLLGPAAGGSGTGLATLQAAVVVAQEQVERYEGVVYELVEDDKGTSLVAAFGLPGTSHPDDPTRALLATRTIHEQLRTLGLSPVSGVATGPLYCGPHGGEHRRHYAVIGATINLAARMASLAGDRGTLCDASTRKLAGPRIVFVEAGWTTPKGFSAPVALFQPTGETAPPPDAVGEQVLVGRTREIGVLAQALDRVIRAGTSSLVVIRAEAGMGKSTLLHAAGRLARERALPFFPGSSDSFETGTAYFAFRRMAREWFDIPGDADAAAGQVRAAAALADAPSLGPLIPLLGRILGFEFPETARTEQVRGQARAEVVRDMLLHVAAKRTARSPMMLAIEDGHWLDAASWSLISALLAHVGNTLVVLTTRPTPQAPGELRDLLAREGTVLIDLEGFGRDESEALLRGQLGVSEVAPAVLDLVTRRAEGNPFFAREVVRSLKESGGIRIRGGRVELVLEEGAALPLPATLEGVITSRIDRLDRPARNTIKVAAVLGRSFDPELLLAVHPSRPTRDALAAQLAALQDAALLTREEPGRGLAFSHALTHEATYNLLSFSQREALHRAAAEGLEKLHAGKLGPVNARLGHHFRMAEMPERAVPYLAAAGEEAVDAYASRDALQLLTVALDLDQRVRGPLDQDLRRARWCRLIAQAHYNQDAMAAAGEWYRRAIRLAGAYPRRKLVGILGIVLRALLTPGRVADLSASAPPPDVRARLIEGLAASRELSVVYLWENAQTRFALTAFSSAAVARALGPSHESAEPFAVLSFLLSVIGFRRAADRISLRAVEMADAVGDIRQFVSTATICAMIHTQNERPFEGLELHQRADQAATALRSGMHRHRPRYMLADSLFWLGRYAEARALFQQSAELSRGAEHHVVGLANAMVALTLIREGRPEAAVNILEAPDGVPSLLEGKVVASIIVGMGILAEARLDLGDRGAALEAVREAEAFLSPRDEGTSYLTTVFGHTAMARVRLETGEPGQPVRRGFRQATPLDLALGRIRLLQKRFPAARGPRALIEGQVAARRGDSRRAGKLFEAAVAAATTNSQPYELGRSLVELARLAPEPRRRELLERAIGVFDAHGMALESGRARTLLDRR
jgi:class 3 adenylate cyclase/tetratricopeptide (TPR) repeat protein